MKKAHLKKEPYKRKCSVKGVELYRKTYIKEYAEKYGKKDMKKCVDGGMTVEASYVMLIVLFLLMVLLKHSFWVHDMTVGSAYLHRAVEIERRLENDTTDIADKNYSTGFLFADDAKITVKKGILLCEGEMKAGEWQKQIAVKPFQPEEYMRAVAAFLPEMGRE